MFTTARLALDDWRTSVRLCNPDWKPGQPHQRFDVVRVTEADRKAAADNELAERGYTRTDGWKYDARRNVYVAAITNA